MQKSTGRSITFKEQELTRRDTIRETLTGLFASQAARRLRLSIRQVFRLKRRYKTEGDKGILHGNRDRTPANAKPRKLRQRVVSL